MGETRYTHPETLESLVHHLRVMSDKASEQIDADRLLRVTEELPALQAENARLRVALAIASSRLYRCSVDYDTGTHEFIETGEWAAEALAALQGEQPRPTEYERKVAQMKEDFPNGI